MNRMMLPLSERQEMLLAIIVHEYIEAAEPVGSVHLVSKYALGVSPATVRNEMGALTDAGLLRQPHTSAGRVPTEEGYRYFVRRLLGETELPVNEKRMISHQFHQARPEVDEWVRLAASVLAHHSQAASLVTAPRQERAVFKHLELISTKTNQVLLVLVLQGGEVRQQVLASDESLDQPRLSQIADQITRACLGQGSQGVAAQASRLSGLSQEVTQLVAELLRTKDDLAAGMIFQDGVSNVLNQPEFASASNARVALRLLEERGFLEEIVGKAISPTVGGVQVVIGGEGAWTELRDWSMILARYGAPGFALGTLGVVGPTRMAYGHTISAVRYVADVMSDLVLETYSS
jgi:heat-inducible transcriptional repressor